MQAAQYDAMGTSGVLCISHKNNSSEFSWDMGYFLGCASLNRMWLQQANIYVPKYNLQFVK